MIKILDVLVAARLLANDDNKVIEISEFFSKKLESYLSENTSTIGIKSLFLSHDGLLDIQLVFYGKTYTIICRGFRGASNDEDLEKLLYELACKQLKQ